jgi:hypothetical protein
MRQRRNPLWLSLLIAGMGLLALLGASSAVAAPTKAMLLITTSGDGELSPCG